jgi:hypothetical protein
MRQKLKYQDVQNFYSWFLLPRRAHSELCNQSGGEKHGQKGKRDWYFNKCLIPKVDSPVLLIDELRSDVKSPHPKSMEAGLYRCVTISGLSLMLLHGANLCVQA